jgi:heme-degrading monooxygenase HmoA
MIRVIIEHKAKDKEAARKLVKVIDQLHSEARKFPGYIRSGTLVNVADPRQVVVLSSWKTSEDFKVWEESQISKSFSPIIEEHLAEQRSGAILAGDVIWREQIPNVFD